MKTLCLLPMVILSALFAACALNSTETERSAEAAAVAADAGPDAAVLREFKARIDKYMQLRSEAVDGVAPPVQTTDPSQIRAREVALAAHIRALRPDAKHGDIFTPEVRVYLRQLLRPELKGQQGRDIRSTLQDDAPAPDAVPLEVNAKYPAGTPLPTTPATLLAVLPPLPRGLEYRIIGKDLLLIDQPADVILDYVRNAIR